MAPDGFIVRPRCSCGHQNPPAANYCTSCGSRLHTVICSACNAPNAGHSVNCERCGHALAAKDPAVLASATGPARNVEEKSTVAIQNDLAAEDPVPDTASQSEESVETAAGEWAGSSRSAFGPRHSGSSRRFTRGSTVTMGIAIAVAAVAALGFYMYDRRTIDAPQPGWVGVVNRGDKAAGAEDPAPRNIQTQSQDAPREARPICTDAVAALGLCSQQPTQRKD